MFLTHDPTQPTKKLKISTQLNPWVDPTHGLCSGQLDT